jgi:hypothetical protein
MTRLGWLPGCAADGEAGANREEALVRTSVVGRPPDLFPLRRRLTAFWAATNSDRLRTPTIGAGRLSARTCHASTGARSAFERGLSGGVEPPLAGIGTTVPSARLSISYG